MTADEVLESEEAYYLRRINGRNNTRILKMAADKLGLSIPLIINSCAYDPYEVAICTTETMVNDMHLQKDGRITVLSKCVDTTRIENGVLCSMHPAEGFWLFKVGSIPFLTFLTLSVRLSFGLAPASLLSLSLSFFSYS